MPDGNTPNTISGRSAFLALLRSEGVSHLFGNPGTTELPIMHALSDEPDLGYVLGLQESVVIGMADGYARASGRLVSVNVHVAPGLGNAIGALYTSWITGSPLIVTAGQQEQGHGLTEPLLYAPLTPIAQPVVKWATEVTRIEDLPRIVHRAAKVATTPPTGPVFISLPGDILNDHAALELGEPTRVDAASRPTDDTVDDLARRILSAKNPLVIAGHEIATSDAFAEAAEFASALGAPVYLQTIACGSYFPSDHPAYMGEMTRAQPVVRERIEGHDMLICLGSDVLKMSVYSKVDPLPPGTRVIQISQRDWELGKNYATEMAVRSDIRETLKVLTPRLKELGAEAAAQTAKERLDALASRNWTAQRAERLKNVDAKRGGGPLDPEWAMSRIAALVPDDVIIVDEGITSTGTLLNYYPFRDRNAYFGNVSGGIGWAIAAAVGIQIAQPERRVVAIVGDGSAQYSIQALWTAAHLKQPVIFVIANNRGYRVLKDRLKLFHDNDRPIGMDFNDPPIDFAAIARGYGVEAHTVDSADRFDEAFRTALESSGPVLLDVAIRG